MKQTLIKYLHLIFFIAYTHTSLGQFASQKKEVSTENMPTTTLKERSWWNLLYYAIDLTPDYNKKFLTGTNNIKFQVVQSARVMRIDLLEPMVILAVTWRKKALPFEKMEQAYLINFPQDLKEGQIETITIQFEGHPKSTNRAPFESGWIWTKDKENRPWMSVACEGAGLCVWLPSKNTLYDEPDNGVSFNITVPDSLIAVANGRLIQKLKHVNGTTTYTWKVINTINSYNITPYIGKYITWHQNYTGLKGKLDVDCWVLDYNLKKAKKHLKQIDTLLHCFESWIGPYPFYEDGYKLVEAPHPGMEHQSAIAYGNGFENGYSGKNISGTEWGLKWDFILIHESGHEWFGNSLTSANWIDGWIHEGFTKYLETLYTNDVYGKAAGDEYARGNFKRIKNDQPAIGGGSSDQYYKGSAMLHMMRQIIGDSAFRKLLQRLGKTFYHQTITTEQVLQSVNESTGKDFKKLFNQYLKTIQIPEFEYTFQNNLLKYRWTNCIDGFDMPLKVSFDGEKYLWLYPTLEWQMKNVATTERKIFFDNNFYIKVKESKF